MVSLGYRTRLRENWKPSTSRYQKKVQMLGWLVVNSFVKKEKFADIYNLLMTSAKKRNVELKLVTTTQLLVPVGEKLPLPKPDFVIFWDKDTVLAQKIESENIPTFNSSTAIALCDNKICTAITLAENNVPHPKTVVAPKTFEGIGYNDDEFLLKAVDVLHFPIVVKEAYGSFGQQVYLAKDVRELKEIVAKINYKDFLMQEFVAESVGRDVRINVVGGKVVCGMLRQNAHDFRSNVSNGGTACAVQLTEEQKAVALQAVDALGLDWAGVDVMFGKNGPIVCEVNSNPHFRSTLDCTGIDVSEHIVDYVIEKISNR